MVWVEKVTGSRTTIRDVGQFEIGDQKDVSPGQARYLVEKRGDFEYVDEPAHDTAEQLLAEKTETIDELREQIADLEEEVASLQEERDDLAAEVDRLRGLEDQVRDAEQIEDDEPDASGGEVVDEDDHAEAFVDRTPMSDVVDDIEAGTVDEALDAVETAEKQGRDRKGVKNAIKERRAELEG